ncbi:MAG TPA: hypothetical protein ENM98_04250 [Halothiobacillaceae bacterium]|nr:hypothetical protein [Halothiobacillaceae bacterium]
MLHYKAAYTLLGPPLLSVALSLSGLSQPEITDFGVPAASERPITKINNHYRLFWATLRSSAQNLRAHGYVRKGWQVYSKGLFFIIMAIESRL